MSEGDNKQDDNKAEADAPKKDGPIRKATLVGMAPVGTKSTPPGAKGTLLGMAPVSDEQIAADKAERLGEADEPKPAVEEPAAEEAAAPAQDAAAAEPEEEASAEESEAASESEEDVAPVDEPAASEAEDSEPADSEAADSEPPPPAEEEPERPADLPPALYLAEFETPDAIVHAAERVRDAGYTKWDCHTPYALHGLDQAMGLAPTKIGVISFIFGLTGVLTAFLLIYCTNAMDTSVMGFAGYKAIVGGKPPGAFPSMVPIMFELGILLCGLSTLLGLLGLNKLPRHHHPVFSSDRFARATDDRYFISIEAADEKFDLEATRELLESTEPSHLELVEEEAA